MQKSQSLLEYATIIAVVAAALMAMHVYVQRATQSNLRLVEDKMIARSGEPPVYTPTCMPNPCNTYKYCYAVSGNCASGYSCLGACTIPVYTPVCKPNPCNTYKDCTAVSGDCSSGYSCSGTCAKKISTQPPEGVSPLPINPDTGTTDWFMLYAGMQRQYYIKIEDGTTCLELFIYPGNTEGMAKFSVTLPDDRVIPGATDIGGEGAGILRFRGKSALFPEEHIDAGYYILTINAQSESYLKVQRNIY